MNDPSAEAKATLRRTLRKLLRAAPPSPFRSEVVAALVARTPPGAPVALYAARPFEQPTDGLAAALAPRPLVWPRIVGDVLEFVHATRFAPDTMGIATPVDGEVVALDACAWVGVPACAVDRRGARLGWGRGFYDRALRAVPRERRIALVRHEQLLPEIPEATWDLRVGWIATPTELFPTPD